jgi:ABC-type Fe3+/spermidine/putrescine transport system ATPase subunit
MRGQPRAGIRRKVAEVLELVQLADFGKRFPAQLSGGQQQRVALARAVVIDPLVLLMDEPLSNLDAKLRDDMREFLVDLQERLNITTILVTHDQAEAMELSGRVAVMFDGRIVQEDAPADLFNRPISRRVADFMGASNFIQGTIVSREDTTVVTELGSLALATYHGETARDVTLTIRPEHIDIADKGRSDEAANTFIGYVETSVFKGGLVHYAIRVGELSLRVLDRSHRQFANGAQVLVRLPPDHLWALPDERTQARAAVQTLQEEPVRRGKFPPNERTKEIDRDPGYLPT